MTVFSGWDRYQERIEKNWNETVKENDTVVIAGDVSWGMSLKGSVPDFRFIDGLAGRKIIIKGNHDYWWATMNKMECFLKEENFSTISILHNNFYQYENYGICGTRGWVSINGEAQDEKILMREVQRLETSITLAEAENLTPIVFLHYPPLFAGSFNYDILEVLYSHNIKDCYYGHIHGRSAHELCIKNTYDGVNFHLISGDYLQFIPQKVL